mgnify:CR=1 FL=1
MAKNNREEDFMDEDVLVEMSDDEGNVYYYAEEMIIPVNGENFAILVAVHDEDEDEHEHHCHCHEDGGECDCDDDEVIIAKIVLNADGEEEYVEPTDEEFDAVQEAYERLMYEADGEE